MSLDIVGLHKLIDQWAEKERAKEEIATEAKVEGEIASPDQPSTDPNATPAVAEKVAEEVAPAEKKVIDGRRVVRTKNSGDRVYMLDDNKKTRQWVTNPAVLKGLGFEMGDVGEIDEAEFQKYGMGGSIFKVPDGPQA